MKSLISMRDFLQDIMTTSHWIFNVIKYTQRDLNEAETTFCYSKESHH